MNLGIRWIPALGTRRTTVTAIHQDYIDLRSHRVQVMTSELIAFIIGTAVGASGQYFASKFTDQRRRQEANRESRDRFKQVRVAIPKLLAEMHDDYMKPENAVLRETPRATESPRYDGHRRSTKPTTGTKRPTS